MNLSREEHVRRRTNGAHGRLYEDVAADRGGDCRGDSQAGGRFRFLRLVAVRPVLLVLIFGFAMLIGLAWISSYTSGAEGVGQQWWWWPSASFKSTSPSPPMPSPDKEHVPKGKVRASIPTATKAPNVNSHMAMLSRIVIVGSGLAGQSAAIQAARDGVKEVVLIEKENHLGGNSAKATSGINGWGTAVQKAAGVHDSGELFEEDTFKSGKGGHCQPDLVKTLSEHSAEAIEWLSSFGVPLTVLTQLGGASRKRCHRTPDKPDGTPLPVGFTIVRTLENYIRANLSDIVRIETKARMLSLLRGKEGDTEVVRGITYVTEGAGGEEQTHELLAQAVILATGGFSNDHTNNSLLQKYAPQLSSFPTTNGVWATGDGVKAARDIGVKLIDMDKVQLHPTGLIDPKNPNAKTLFLGPEALRGSGGILLNKNGERFVDELDLRSVVSQAIIEQKNIFAGTENRRYAYCVLNEAAADAFGRGALNFYWKKMGLFSDAADVPALASLIGCPVETLMQTLVDYEKLSAKGQHPCNKTRKSVFPCPLGPQGPFYVAYVTPSIHYTMGGCLISPSAEIVDNGLHPIIGLYGAGEVTGGVHGGNRLGGNSLLECVVFGRIAGHESARRRGG